MKQEFWSLFLVILLTACSTLPTNPQRNPTMAMAPNSASPLAQILNEKLGNLSHDESAFTPLIRGEEALVSRLVSASLATRSLDLQYYIWANDLTGMLLLDYVLQAADRGVRVRLLLDDLNQGKYENFLAVLSSHPNIEVRMANPFANRKAQWLDILRFSEANKRMHNKVFIADNQLAIVGGRNIGDVYFAASNEMNFGDFDLWAAGNVVQDFSKEFDTYWNSEIAYPIEILMPSYHPAAEDLAHLRQQTHQAKLEAEKTDYAKALMAAIENHILGGIHQPIFRGRAEVAFDPPEKFQQSKSQQIDNLQQQLKPLVADTKKELILVSPYFIPGTEGLDFFKDLQLRKIRTLVLTNSLASSDVTTVFSGYKGSRQGLLQSGVELFELKSKVNPPKKRSFRAALSTSHSGLHGKIFIFDRQKIFVGSMNLDPRSLYLNSEMGVIVESPALASFIAEKLLAALPENAYKLRLTPRNIMYWKTTEKGDTIFFDKDPETSWWKRFKAGFMSLIVPKSQL